MNKAVVSMLASAPQALGKDPQLVASMIQGAMAGVSRRLLESTSPEKQYKPLSEELVLMMRVYLTLALSASPIESLFGSQSLRGLNGGGPARGEQRGKARCQN